MVTERDFLLPPWSVEELEACFFASDATGQKLAYVYFEDDPGRRTAAKLLTKDEAHRWVRPAFRTSTRPMHCLSCRSCCATLTDAALPDDYGLLRSLILPSGLLDK
jgi:hypothetical protein